MKKDALLTISIGLLLFIAYNQLGGKKLFTKKSDCGCGCGGNCEGSKFDFKKEKKQKVDKPKSTSDDSECREAVSMVMKERQDRLQLTKDQYDQMFAEELEKCKNS